MPRQQGQSSWEHRKRRKTRLDAAQSRSRHCLCERALKKAILHRKNALFYKTLNGAHVGDDFMSLIHSAELNGVKPFDYLVALLRHHEQLEDAPADWMPWNYATALACVREDRPSPTAP